MPMTKLKAEPKAKLRSLKARSSTMGSRAVSTRAKKTKPAKVANAENVAIVRSSSQS